MVSQDNPLFTPQREKAGSETFEKYSYQYHWALYRVLTEHEEMKEYAVFVELHEDVVVSDSLKSEDAKFEFNQIKTIKQTFTSDRLLKPKNGKSVLGKLIANGNNSTFNSRITNLNLVSLNNFSLELKVAGSRLNKIVFDDLSDNQIKLFEDAMEIEIGKRDVPKNLQFIVPDLSEKNFQNDIIASIARLIIKLFPSSFCNPVEIYRLLIDELNRKGIITTEYTKWDDVLNKKALTSTTVSNVIEQFTIIKDEYQIEAGFNRICDELRLKIIQSKKLKRSFNRYRSLRISNKSTVQIDTTKSIVQLINKNLSEGVEDIEILITNVCSSIPAKIKAQFPAEDDLKSAVICEYIIMN